MIKNKINLEELQILEWAKQQRVIFGKQVTGGLLEDRCRQMTAIKYWPEI